MRKRGDRSRRFVPKSWNRNWFPLNRLLADPIKRNKEVAEVFPSENPAMISVSQFLARDSNLTQ